MPEKTGLNNNPFMREGAADKYDRSLEMWPFLKKLRREEAATLNRLFDRYLNKDNCVLEIGAGTGYYTIGIAKRVKTLVALEPSQAMISVLRGKIEISKIENIALVEKDFFIYSHPRQYDWVIAIGVLDYIENWEEFLKKCLDLSPNLIFTVPQRGLWSMFYKIFSRWNGITIYRYTPRQLSKYLGSRPLEFREAGFKTPLTLGHTLVVVSRC